jgi:hypothetical protein
MREIMNLPETKKIPVISQGPKPFSDNAETVPMHPEDFKAHLAWITAKRISEMVLKETPGEKTVYYRIVG